MKITTLILLTTMMQVSAATYAQRVTLSEKNMPLTEVLKKIKKQTGYEFLYGDRVLNNAKSVTINLTDQSLKDALDQIFKSQELIYLLQDKTVIVQPKEESVLNRIAEYLTAAEVHGLVIEENGQPLPGATVRVKNSKHIVITDEHGLFFLKGVNEEDVLIVSYTGYKSMEILVKDIPKSGIALEPATSNLDEITVVNTGYQMMSKERSAGSFAKPDMDQFKNANSGTDIISRLDGLVTGITINNSPGASSVLVRGLTSINSSTTPLYVVDGLPTTDISTINFNDVADITILKDATAASIWGARAANGVITITTKKGGNDNHLKIDYDVTYSFKGKPDLEYAPVMNSQQFIQAVKEVYNPAFIAANPWQKVSTSTTASIYPHEQIIYDASRHLISDAQKNAKLDSLAGTDNLGEIKDLFYRNALYANHSLAVSGGGKVHSFRGAVSYVNNTNTAPGDKNNAYNVLLRNDLDLGKRIKAYLITQVNNSTVSSKRPGNYGPTFVPYQLFQDANGNNRSLAYLSLPDSLRKAYESKSGVSLDYNPLDEVNSGSTKTSTFSAKVTGGVTVNLIDGLRFEGVYGYQKANSKTSSLDDTRSYTVRSERVQFTPVPVAGEIPKSLLPAAGDLFSAANTENTNWTVRNQLVYDQKWMDGKHQLTVLAGQEAQDQQNGYRSNTLRGYNPQLLSYGAIDYNALMSTGLANPIWSNNGTRGSILFDAPYAETESEFRFDSYYANGAYTYSRKYTINGSWRIDHSNLFGKDKSAQGKPVWSAGAAWIISNEDFMKEILWLDRLTLRGTYGLTGNSPLPGTAASYDIVGPSTSAFYPNGQGLVISTPANKSLTWESTKTFNLGLDFLVLRNRLGGSIDFYKKNTDNLIGVLPLNIFSGYSTITGNYGNMTNKGVELSLNSININTRDFSWRSNFILSYNKNEITRLLSSTAITTGQQLIAQPYVQGYSAYAVFAYNYARLDHAGDPQVRLANGTVTKAIGATAPADIRYMGTYQPVWSGGLSNMFSYKRFSLSGNIVYNLGNVMHRNMNTIYTDRISKNLNTEFANRWKQPDDELTTNIPSYIANISTSSTQRNISYYVDGDLNVVSASFIKLRDLSLSYSLPGSILQKLKINEISFRAGISNIMLWKGNKDGIDPEFQNAGNQPGNYSLPVNQHAVTLGAHVTF